MKTELIDLVEQDCGQGRRSGRWWMFHCPFPGHAQGDRNPSLAVTPDNGRWHCFTCGRSGNAIGWLVEYRGLSYGEAKKMMGVSISANHGIQNLSHGKNTNSQLTHPETWQARGQEFIQECQQCLSSIIGQRALDYLHKRGLKDATIERYKLGFSSQDRHDPAQLWGYCVDDCEIFLPRGITIPHIVRGELLGVNIRRSGGNPKYIKLRGSKSTLFGADNLRGSYIIVLCEGEFDCMILDQEIGDAVGVATLGSAGKHLDLAVWGPYLMLARHILVAYDGDAAGQQGSRNLAALGNKIKPILLPPGPWKDINDFYLSGGDLWIWIENNIPNYQTLESENLVDVITNLGGIVHSSWNTSED